MGRTDAVARLTRHEGLHGAVLERVERDDREPTARTKDPERRGEALREIAELVVDGHPERLEYARRRIDLGAAGGLDAGDEPAELVSCRERPAGPAAHDRRGDARGLGLLAELGEDPPQRAVVPGVHDVGGRDGEPWIGAHVEGSARVEAEASGIVGQLDRGEAEIEEDAVELAEAVLTGDGIANREVRLNEDGAIAEGREARSGDGERGGIDVEAKKSSIRRAAFEECGSMPATADRAIEEAATFARSKAGEDLGQENRLVS